MSHRVDFEPDRKDLMDRADLDMRSLMREAGVTAGLVVLEGSTTERVKQEALEQKADLLITGRGHHQEKIMQMFSQLYRPTNTPCYLPQVCARSSIQYPSRL